jgi:hypothetical protein
MPWQAILWIESTTILEAVCGEVAGTYLVWEVSVTDVHYRRRYHAG